MTREQKYIMQMRQIGIYQEAFDPAIHTLAMMEREHQRTLKLWKAGGGKTDNELYAVVVQQRRDILAHRDALGLTPKALRRLKPVVGEGEDTPGKGAGTVLELVRGRHRTDA